MRTSCKPTLRSIQATAAAHSSTWRGRSSASTALSRARPAVSGISLAISSNLATNVMDQLLKNGKVNRGYMGVQVQNLDPEIASRLGLKDGAGGLLSQGTGRLTPAQ